MCWTLDTRVYKFSDYHVQGACRKTPLLLDSNAKQLVEII